MADYSLSEIKKELQTKNPKELLEICLSIIKLKMENKTMASYILFESDNKANYIEKCKDQIENLFAITNLNNWYVAKKGLRKILRETTKRIKVAKDKQVEVELLIHYCKQLKAENLVHDHPVIFNLYQSQINKINKAMLALHEDLRFDYHSELKDLGDI